MISPAIAARRRRAHPPLPAAVAAPPAGLTPIVGVGARGCAKSLIDAVGSVFRFRVVALLDGDPALAGTEVLGCPVVGGDAFAALRARGVEHGFVALGGPARATGAALLREAGFRLPPIVHGAAVVSRAARLGDGAGVLAGAIVGAGAELGRHALVEPGAIVGEDAWVADGVTVGAGAVLAPGAVVEHDVPAGDIVRPGDALRLAS